ncbi:hypothetical protein ACP4OV_004747 [Aristida adscensionis]
MDAQDDGGQSGQRKKPHGNPFPRRGTIKKVIINDWIGKKDPTSPGGGGGGNDDDGNGGGGGSS